MKRREGEGGREGADDIKIAHASLAFSLSISLALLLTLTPLMSGGELLLLSSINRGRSREVQTSSHSFFMNDLSLGTHLLPSSFTERGVLLLLLDVRMTRNVLRVVMTVAVLIVDIVSKRLHCSIFKEFVGLNIWRYLLQTRSLRVGIAGGRLKWLFLLLESRRFSRRFHCLVVGRRLLSGVDTLIRKERIIETNGRMMLHMVGSIIKDLVGLFIRGQQLKARSLVRLILRDRMQRLLLLLLLLGLLL